MKHRRFPSSIFPLSIIFLVLDVRLSIPQSLGNPYLECFNGQFKCGNFSAGYPFYGESMPEGCGYPGLRLGCEYDNTATIGIGGVRYKVLHIDRGRRTLRIARQDLINNDSCKPEFPSSNFDNELFELAPGYAYVTLLYGCLNFTTQPPLVHPNCSVNEAAFKEFWVGWGVSGSWPCSDRVTVPIDGSYLEGLGKLNYLMFTEVLKQGFEVKWKKDSQLCDKCEEIRGLCGYNDVFPNQRVCYCPNPNDTLNGMTDCSSPAPDAAPRSSGTQHKDGKKNNVSLITGLAIGVPIAIVVVCIIFFIFLSFKGKQLSNRLPGNLLQQKMNNDASVEAFITEFGSLGPKRYFYKDIKKMTNKFMDKIGQGGYGSVYKGTMPDGRLVAVKVLSEYKGNGEDFMNEIASISRTSHVNIVTLLGFCYDRSKRALVYEFMPLGSLDKFIYNQGSQDQSRQMVWKTLYEIALGIARGLEYLHQGCNTRILHFDIKPHNILLDENFFPKISDFGLSKLCERKESVISMTGARGTAGYIAPEVFSRNFGRVSHKSDIYSYGMMILEMVGGRKNINIEVSESSQIYFPSWMYRHINQAMNLSLPGVTTEEEEEITRRLILVSLWCIQTNPLDRPSVTKVLEMLQGSLQSLEIPPCPFLSSPVRSPKTVSTTFIDDP
ncbi:hypothetical protein DITRI_Ditri11bG0012800 [Diplodiscus trichospermus]